MFRLRAAQSRRLEQLIACLEAGALAPVDRGHGWPERGELGALPFRDAADAERLRRFALLAAKQGLSLETVNLLHWVVLVGRYPKIEAFRDAANDLRFEPYPSYFRKLCELGEQDDPGSGLTLVSPSQLLIDVTHTLAYENHSGIQRLVRSLCRSLWEQGLPFEMFVWRDDRAMLLEDASRARVLEWSPPDPRPKRVPLRTRVGAAARRLLAREDPPEDLLLFAGNPVLLPEVTLSVPRNEIYPSLRSGSLLHLGLILYDFIPIFHPEYCDRGVRAEFPGFLQLLRHADKIAPISRAVGRELEHMLPMIPREREHPLEVRVIPLAGGLLPTPDALRSEPPRAAGPPLVLCVGSIEPRKNGKGILRAAIEAMKRGHRFELLFVGNRGWLAEDFEALVERHRQQGFAVGIRYLVSEPELERLYRSCRFTMFCSFAEGAGLPILESLRHGIPCITSAGGSMQELAEGGGCLSVDPRSIEQMAAAIVSLLDDEAVYAKLRAEIAARRIRSWDEYAAEVFAFFSQG